MKLQAERFRAPVFRIFHAEQGTVYEDKKCGLDNDNSKMQEAMFEMLFPGHKYGTQTTIGTIEHPIARSGIINRTSFSLINHF